MSTFTRTLSALLAASALTVSGLGVATAQSSLSSLSSAPVAPSNPHAAEAARLKSTLEASLIRGGHHRNEGSESTARYWIGQALRGEVEYDADGLSWGQSPDGHTGFIGRILPANVDTVINNFSGMNLGEAEDPTGFGVAASSDARYIYVAVAIQGNIFASVPGVVAGPGA